MTTRGYIVFSPGGSYISGKEILTAELLRGLRAKGWGGSVVVPTWNDGSYGELLRAQQIPFQEVRLGILHRARLDWTVETIRRLPQGIRDYWTKIRSLEPDFFVHTNTKQILPVRRLLGRDTRHLLHVHDLQAFSPKDPFAGRSLNTLDAIICISEFVASQFDAIRDRVPIFVVRNGTDTRNLMPARRHRSPVVFGIVGQVIKRKRHSIAVAAARIVKDQIPDAQFLIDIVGNSETEYGAYVRSEIERHALTSFFRWRGFVQSRTEIYGPLDVLLAPAVDEPFGLTLVEASSFGCPVIAANSGAFPEIMARDSASLMVAPDDPKALASAMIELLCSPQKRQEYGALAHKHVGSRFSLEHMVNEFEQALWSI